MRTGSLETAHPAMPDHLKKYRQMRDFSDTPEPAGGEPEVGTLPIFVIQKHQASHLHYDFRLEMEGVLKSWAVPKGPAYDPSVKRLAMMTEDHPYDYAAFEGQIPEGNYGAGSVIIWDQGQWEFIEPGDDPVNALKSGKLTFRMFGKKMFGEWALVRIKGRSSSQKGNEWLLLKHADEFANTEIDVTRVAPRSVVSNLLVEEIGDDNVWQSNRKAASRRVRTLADRAEKPSSGRAGKSSRKKAAPAKKATRAKPLEDSKGRSLVDSKKKAAAKKARPRAASARSRSSPAGATRPARTIARRPPR